MTHPDISVELRSGMPQLRGRLTPNAPMADITWFRAGGPAQVLFSPQDEADLAYFLKTAPADLPVFVIGLGSNLLVRDGGVRGVVIRLGRGFGDTVIEPGHRVRTGTVVPDAKVARQRSKCGHRAPDRHLPVNLIYSPPPRLGERRGAGVRRRPG